MYVYGRSDSTFSFTCSTYLLATVIFSRFRTTYCKVLNWPFLLNFVTELCHDSCPVLMQVTVQTPVKSSSSKLVSRGEIYSVLIYFFLCKVNKSPVFTAHRLSVIDSFLITNYTWNKLMLEYHLWVKEEKPKKLRGKSYEGGCDHVKQAGLLAGISLEYIQLATT